MRKPLLMALTSFVVGFLGTALLTSCGDSQTGEEGGTAETPEAVGPVHIYAARKAKVEDHVKAAFEATYDDDVVVDTAKNANDHIARIEAEKEAGKSRADVLWVTDPAALGAASRMGLLAPLPQDILDQVPAAWRSAKGDWVGLSGRVRVVAYNPEELGGGELPQTIFDLTDPIWKGRVGWAPKNGSFQAFLTAMISVHGAEKTETWLKGMVANEAKVYPKNTPIVKALANGEITLGITNHYYVIRAQADDANIPVKIGHFAKGDVGNLVMVTGAGILKDSDNAAGGEAFVRHLLNDASQGFFTQTVKEYPARDGIGQDERLDSLEAVRGRAPAVDLSSLEGHEATIALLKKLGLL